MDAEDNRSTGSPENAALFETFDVVECLDGEWIVNRGGNDEGSYELERAYSFIAESRSARISATSFGSSTKYPVSRRTPRSGFSLSDRKL